ncbi:MAG: ATP-binding protein [Anaerolineae bacterium]|nr:ATP-binding protein [Anaerolineae bacterium]
MSNIKPSAAMIAQQQAAKRQGGSQESAQPTGAAPVAGRYGVGVGDQWQPPPVTSIQDTGLNQLAVADLVLKVLYFSGFLTGYQIADIVKLPFNGVIDGVMEFLKREQWAEVKGSGGFGEGTYQYVITGGGVAKAREALERSQYAGPAPVPLATYCKAIQEQHRRTMVTQDMLSNALSHLVISQKIFDKVGPAVNSGRSIFLYGPPGNGKTTISEAVGRVVLGQALYIPYSIDIDGQCVRVFDSVNHETIEIVEDSAPSGATKVRPDARWIKIKRPVIIVGGELTLETLDLVYDPVNKYYEAPFQVKSNGGMFLIDDFGRQQVRPRDLLNRWIVPLEKRVDYLTLANGRKIEVPFDVLIVFSTNLEPRDLVDEAFLRRIRHKIDIFDPTYEEFREIFIRVSKARGLAYDDKILAYLLQEWYIQKNRPLRSVHPRDLIDQMKDISSFLGVPFEMNKEMIDRACEAYFVEL